MTSRPSSKSPTSPPGSQPALAKLAGVTQARVSTIGRDLERAGLVSTERGRPLVTHRDRLVHEWLKRRRFDPIVTYWSTTSDLASALDTALKRLPGPVIVSVDVAADTEGPHRRPVQLLVLAQGGSLAGPGMRPVLSADEAHEAEWRGRTFLAGDPLQVLWNLESAAGTDATVLALADLATAVTVRRSATGSTAARMAASRR